MATAFVNVATVGTDLVAAQSGKIIRLLRIVAGAGASVTISSNATVLLPELKSGISDNVDIVFPPGSVATVRGEALRAQAAAATVAVWVEYDVVD